ncbi:DUF924 family protein [Gilvimarinus sp. SDUM040013]|uniref:DUF924 family protein n=1 Tax=Gilvimarinus gilvus TaxID=3058038 RepID=A0ABU4RYI3_9GAMM|nr:DUF924 family protein [Gilvimarinus sp. SDUM040013]MDO3387368.1 DUF924 family protein [Gilvimarinus sp. SDUM040013]MDX6849845.1 DUF924 family protein [Gilvimarinus sp. SDUM040013]
MEASRLNAVIQFWFVELSSSDWFGKNPAVDQLIKQRFAGLHSALVQGEGQELACSGVNVLSQVIVLDQFSRNIYRDDGRAFAFDDQALALSRQAIEQGWDEALKDDQRAFLYMPFMHSERAEVHEQALALFGRLDNKNYLEFEYKHKAIIDRFGRYPHRNKLLNRVSTDEERAFLATPGSSF